MTKVLFHIPIRSGGPFGPQSWLMETYYDLDFLPNEGELFEPLKNDPESGLTMEIRRRWWNGDGSVTMEMHTYVLEPEEDITFNMSKLYRQWNSSINGDLVELLRQNGWWEYGNRPEISSEMEVLLEELEKKLKEGVISMTTMRQILGIGDTDG